MSAFPDRTVVMTQNDYSLFKLICETLSPKERAALIKPMLDYQDCEIEARDVFRVLVKNSNARWEAEAKA